MSGRPVDTQRKLQIVRAVMELSVREVLARRGSYPYWLRRLSLRPEPAVYGAVAKAHKISRDRVSHLANDRALWRQVKTEFWPEFQEQLNRRLQRRWLDASMRQQRETQETAARRRARDGVKILEHTSASERDRRKEEWIASITRQAAAGQITGDEAARLRRELYELFAKRTL